MQSFSDTVAPPGPGDIWRALGGVDHPPSCLGQEFGTCLVVGDARCVWADIAAWEAHAGAGTTPVLCVGQAGMNWPPHRLDYWASLHSEDTMWGFLLQYRQDVSGDGRVQTIAPRPGSLVKNVLPCSETFVAGTSGLYGALAALMLGFDAVVLAGMPLDGGGRFHEPPGRSFADYGSDTGIDLAWRQAIKRLFAGRVTSLSGRTRAWLGAPEGVDGRDKPDHDGGGEEVAGDPVFAVGPRDPAWRG